MTDVDAYMALALNNAQGELSPLEVGMHALGSGLSQREYAERAGLAKTTLQDRWQAAGVATMCTHMRAADLADRWRHLAELHVAPSWLWPALVTKMVERSWTVEAARKAAGALIPVTLSVTLSEVRDQRERQWPGASL